MSEIEAGEQARRLADAHYRRKWRDLGIYTGRTLSAEMRIGAGLYGDTELVFASRQRPARTTLAAAYADAARVAAGLAALGLRRGDHLAVQLPHWREGLLLQIAAFMLGLVAVPIVAIYGPAELGFILRQTRARALAIPDRWRGSDYAARVAACGALPDLENLIVVGEAQCAGPVIYWDDLLARGDAHGTVAPDGDADDVALMIYTSGTTSLPKGVQHSHHSMGCELRSSAAFAEIRERRTHFCAFPAGHSAGFLWMMRPFFHGNPLVILDQWHAGDALEAIQRHRVVASGGTPFHFMALMDELGSGRFTALTSYLVGSTSVPPAVVERAAEYGVGAYRCYGGTEHPTITSNFPQTDLHHRATTDGRLLPHCAIRLVDDDGREVPLGEPGEIISTGPELMLGYSDPALNQDAFDAQGWYRTGDIGVLDGDGYLTIVDRKKDIIIRGGEKISSKEIEDILQRHPDVAEAAVVGWPDARLGERVAAVLRLQPGRELGISALRDYFATTGLARQKTPEHLVLVEDFPRTAAGKVQKPPLRRQIAELAARTPLGTERTK